MCNLTWECSSIVTRSIFFVRVGRTYPYASTSASFRLRFLFVLHKIRLGNRGGFSGVGASGARGPGRISSCRIVFSRMDCWFPGGQISMKRTDFKTLSRDYTAGWMDDDQVLSELMDDRASVVLIIHSPWRKGSNYRLRDANEHSKAMNLLYLAKWTRRCGTYYNIKTFCVIAPWPKGALSGWWGHLEHSGIRR